MYRTHLVALGIAAGLALGTQTSQATVITFDFDRTFTDTSVAPETSPPWLRATFDDSIGGGAVRVRIEALALEPGQFADEFWFNLDPALDPANLLFTSAGGVAFDHTHPPAGGAGALPVPGGHVLDFKIHFPNVHGDRALEQGEFALIDISLLGGTLTPGSFDALSEPGEGGSRLLAATHIQGTGADNEDSAWATPTRVHEPTALALVLAAMTGVGSLRRRG